MTNPLTAGSGQQIDRLVDALDSLIDGDLTDDMLVTCGKCAVPHLVFSAQQDCSGGLSCPRSALAFSPAAAMSRA
jgi:hypothetical protein